jgi:molybdate/tungstate transport system ATP-binding protein
MTLIVERLTARAGDFTLDEASLQVQAGGYGVVIGPAGAGKTTLLEAIAGVVPVRSGRVLVAGRDVTHAGPEARGIGLVYQHGYLFPHLTVQQNIAYGAANADLPRQLVEQLGIAPLGARTVTSLSGGERQLVALARALARRPGVLLLDEPFAALDPRTRTATRRALRQLHRDWGFTVLHVTHDFAEAGSLGDVAVLLDRGRVVQAAPPEQLFRAPATAAAADFLGAENVFAAQVIEDATGTHASGADSPESGAAGQRSVLIRIGALVLHAVTDHPPGPAHAVIRGEEIVLSLGETASSMRNHVGGVVQDVERHGPVARVVVQAGDVHFTATITAGAVSDLGIAAGVRVSLSFKAAAVHVC